MGTGALRSGIALPGAGALALLVLALRAGILPWRFHAVNHSLEVRHRESNGGSP